MLGVSWQSLRWNSPDSCLHRQCGRFPWQHSCKPQQYVYASRLKTVIFSSAKRGWENQPSFNWAQYLQTSACSQLAVVGVTACSVCGPWPRRRRRRLVVTTSQRSMLPVASSAKTSSVPPFEALWGAGGELHLIDFSYLIFSFVSSWRLASRKDGSQPQEL